MAGGTWTRQNKVRPGAYINFKSKSRTPVTIGERGIVTMPLILPFGPEKQILEIDASTNLFDLMGFYSTDSEVFLIGEALKRAKTLLLYRLNDGQKAAAVIGELTVEAKYGGTKGNGIKIVIQNNIDDETAFDVITLMGSSEIDKQTGVKTIADLVSNPLVVFKGEGTSTLTTTAGIPLENGTDAAVTNQNYIEYLAAVELYEFNTMGMPTKDGSIKSVAASFIKRLREQEGRKVQVVLEKYPEADYEGVISVKNGVKLSDGTIISSDKAVAFVAGATAGANINESNTYSHYDGAVDVDIRYTDGEIKAALLNGEIVFTIINQKVVIEQDINTLKTFTKDKGKVFRKNRPIRTLDGINNDAKLLWATTYTGKEDNNADGRDLYRKDIIKLLEAYQKNNALQNVIPEDVEIAAGDDGDAVTAVIAAQPVDSMEKLYMTVEVV
jgi:hypothetical protein